LIFSVKYLFISSCTSAKSLGTAPAGYTTRISYGFNSDSEDLGASAELAPADPDGVDGEESELLLLPQAPRIMLIDSKATDKNPMLFFMLTLRSLFYMLTGDSRN